MTATIIITDKGKTITYHAHHMRDVIEPVKQYGLDSTGAGTCRVQYGFQAFWTH